MSLIGATVVGIVFMLAALVPSTRVAAQQAGIGWHTLDQFWYWITVNRNQELVLLGELQYRVRSLAVHAVIQPSSPEAVADATEASRRSGFIPRMPGPGALPGRPRLSVLGPASFGNVFRAAELESALRHSRVTGQPVPAAWDAAWIGVQIGKQVIAEWSDVPNSGPGTGGWAHVTLAQSMPPVFALPPGIDLTSFAALNLRTTWMNADTALRFAQYGAPSAALLLAEDTPKPPGLQAEVEASFVNLPHGTAILIEEWGELSANGKPAINPIILLWSVPDRVYVLKGELRAPLELESYDLAGAVATIIDLAGTIN